MSSDHPIDRSGTNMEETEVLDGIGRSALQPNPVKRRKTRLNRQPLNTVFIAPWLLGLLLFTGGPLIAALVLSFTDYALLRPPEFVGLANYERMFTSDAKFIDALSITFLYVAASVPLTLVASLLLAVALNKGLRLLGLFRSVYYLPSLLGGSLEVDVISSQSSGGGGISTYILDI